MEKSIFEEPININNSQHKIVVTKGINKDYISNINTNWHEFLMKYLAKLSAEINSEDELSSIIENENFGDFYWDWNSITLNLNSKNECHFLFIDDRIEAIIITYHPKYSVLDNNDIFFIERFATAPWNRKVTSFERKYTGIGTLFLKILCSYYRKELHYRYGFSLLSLSSSKTFYEKIGMKYIEKFNESGMFYYEISEKDCKNFVEGGRNDY